MVSRGPHAGKETTVPRCDLIGIATYSPPRFVCRGSRGRQGLNVDPPPPPPPIVIVRRRMSCSGHKGENCSAFFSIVKQLRTFPLLHGAVFGNPPNHILIIHPVEYITTSHARGGGTRTSRESPSASEQDGRVGSFPAAHRTCICFETLPASVPVHSRHSRQLYPTRFVSDPKARTTDQTEGECALLWVALFCCGENLPNPTCRAPPVSFTAPHSVPQTAVSANATPLRSPTQFPLSSDNVFLITMRLPTSCIRPKKTPPLVPHHGQRHSADSHKQNTALARHGSTCACTD